MLRLTVDKVPKISFFGTNFVLLLGGGDLAVAIEFSGEHWNLNVLCMLSENVCLASYPYATCEIHVKYTSQNSSIVMWIYIDR